MFGKLPDLFDRNFAVGYFLPTSMLIIAAVFLADAYGYHTQLLAFNTQSSVDTSVETTLVVIISWLISVILLGANRELYRVLEGYGKWNPFRLFQWFEIRKYRNWSKEIKELGPLGTSEGLDREQLMFKLEAAEKLTPSR